MRMLSVCFPTFKCKYPIPNSWWLVALAFESILCVGRPVSACRLLLFFWKQNLICCLRRSDLCSCVCAHTHSVMLAARPFFKMLKLLLALIFRCAHFKTIAHARHGSARQGKERCANQKVIIYVCWLSTTTKEINNHIEFTHWAQQVRLCSHLPRAKPEKKRGNCERRKTKSVPHCVGDRLTIAYWCFQLRRFPVAAVVQRSCGVHIVIACFVCEYDDDGDDDGNAKQKKWFDALLRIVCRIASTTSCSFAKYIRKHG